MSHKDKVAANKAKSAPKVAVDWSSELALAVGYKDQLLTKYPNATQKFLDFRFKQYHGTYLEALGNIFRPSPGKGRHEMRKFVRTTLILPTEQMSLCGENNTGKQPLALEGTPPEELAKYCRWGYGCKDCLPGKYEQPYTKALTAPEKALAASIRRRDLKATPSLLDRIAASTEAARKAQRDAEKQAAEKLLEGRAL